MNSRQFDTWVQQIAAGLASRRTALRALVGAALGSLASPVSRTVDAKRRRKKRKKKKKVTFNDFGCVNVGKFCKSAAQCCSGICQGKKGKKKCQSHDTGGCQAGTKEGDCGGLDVPCTSGSGEDGLCNTTTGNAGYCTVRGNCFACTKDADCQLFCGPTAACIICSSCEETGGAACVTSANCRFGD